MDQAHSGGAHINRMLKSYTSETFPEAIPVPPASVSSSGMNLNPLKHFHKAHHSERVII